MRQKRRPTAPAPATTENKMNELGSGTAALPPNGEISKLNVASSNLPAPSMTRTVPVLPVPTPSVEKALQGTGVAELEEKKSPAPRDVKAGTADVKKY